MASISTIPSKEWMTKKRFSEEYLNGVLSFLKHLKQNSQILGGDDYYHCPCVKCRNTSAGRQKLHIISEHLICDGIDKSYTKWTFHGEQWDKSHITVDATSHSNRNEDAFPRMVEMVNDALGRHIDEENVEVTYMDEYVDENDTQVHDDSPNDIDYKKMIADALQPLYPSCRMDDTKLSVTVELLSMKARHHWSHKSFDELLQMMKRILPNENTLPETIYNAKKMIKSLRMECEIIHACPNDCILYWKEHEHKDKCPNCGESRWKSVIERKSRSKRLPQKKLRYFPITPRLKRMYSVSWIAEKMQWHANASQHGSERFMRHPMDSTCWRGVNRKWEDFAAEPRNVRLGLATDGFNPFGNKNNSYSCWPVMIVPYNLPPSLCMQKEFTMLALLIPGKNGPGHDIDVYLQPLIAELNSLWSLGTETYDSSTKHMFNMRAILLWAIHDFPAYGHMSGCRTAGKYGCPACGEGTESMWLKYGGKFAFMGHRKFLTDQNHKFRLQKSQFNGEEEHRRPSRRLSGIELLTKLETIQTEFGKLAGKKRKRSPNDDTPWSKRSIFFDLPYWKDLPIRHNLDVMHIEKNVAENLIATIMNTKDKTKDGRKARLDLKNMRIKRDLWPMNLNSREVLPKAPYELSREEKELICSTLYNLKVPVGYSSNWKHNVSLQELQLKNLKSHDYHILMQQLLPVLLMHAFDTQKQKPLHAAIRQLSIFFNVLCSKVIDRKELQSIKGHIVETLCVFEKYFPSAFFVSMIHVMVHLVEEALMCGPVRYRWMYPFERMMKNYKRYVVNQTFPEGSITECYLMEEAMMYSMDYMPENSRRAGGHQRGRNKLMDDDGDPSYPIDKNGKLYVLTPVQYQQVRKWVLRMSAENFEWDKKYQEYLQNHNSRVQNRKSNARSESALAYVPWVRQQLQDEVGPSIMKRLANGPNVNAISYNAYAVNGYIFYTAEYEMNMSTQNSGVSMKAVTSFRASVRDTNLVDEEVTYYGIVRKILELDYFEFKETVFYCDWVRIEDSNGYVLEVDTNLRYVNLGRLMRNSKEDDEPFILASQANQVFYCKDQGRPADAWHVILDAPKRLNQDVDAYEDPLVFAARTNADALTSALQDDIMEEHDEN